MYAKFFPPPSSWAAAAAALSARVHSERTAWFVLVISLAVTLFSWYVSARFAQITLEERFASQVQKARSAIPKRMQEYEQVLRGGVGLMVAADPISRQKWRRYMEALDLSSYWPGVQGVGYAEMIAPADLDRHIANVRRQGFPDYSVRPQGSRDQYSSIVYLEPFSGRNLRAFGYDMYSEPVRRAAMKRARDSGQPSLSGKVTLVQEDDKDVQAGFLMYLPLYRNGMPIETTEQRREALQGFVYSPFRIKDLMNGILGTGEEYLEFQIFDGPEANLAALLYESPGYGQTFRGEESMASTETIPLPGRTWTARFRATRGLTDDAESNQPMLIGLGGLLADGLLFGILMSLSRNRRQLEHLSEHDALTGLPNRVGLLRRLPPALAEAARNRTRLAVAFLDMDGFKSINDTLGHAAGDQALVEIATRLRAVIRHEDMVARIAGDEFILVLSEVDADRFPPILDRINRLLSASLRISQRKFMFSASIGYTVYPDDEVAPEELIQHADIAMYAAKQAGGGIHRRYDASFLPEERSRSGGHAHETIS